VTDQELRAIVRDAIARHGAGRMSSATDPQAVPFTMLREHPSHGLLQVPTGADADGPCVIEPAVQCNHCGYCKSYGH
jgi:hypothetical protein